MTHLYVHHDFKPVGQGLFAFGEVEFHAFLKGRRNIRLGKENDWKFSWVYDCGTSSGQALVHRGIRDIAARMAGRQIDLIVISHLHADHVSGLIRLLKETGAKTIMFPWAPLWQRLLIGFEQGLGAEDPEMSFYVDPVNYLGGEAGDTFERVIFVLPSTGGGAPDPEQPIPGIDPTDLGPREDSKRFSGGETDDGTPGKLELPDTWENRRFAIPLSPQERLVRGGIWEFLPYNDPKSAPKSPGTVRSAVKELSAVLLGPDMKARATALASLKKLYRKEFAAGLQNDLSLNLYTGPVPLGTFIPNPMASETAVRLLESRLPILYTGDGNYSTKTHWRRLSNYLGPKRIKAIGTFQIPHHGSKRNWNKGMAELVSPFQSIFSSDPEGRYGHPDPEVLRDFHPYDPVQVNKHTGHPWNEHLQPVGK